MDHYFKNKFIKTKHNWCKKRFFFGTCFKIKILLKKIFTNF